MNCGLVGKRGINLRFKKWIGAAAASVLLAMSFSAAPIQAEEERTIADESIYDVLVDRYFNGSGANDKNVDTQDPTQFAGGDFAGLISRGDHIKEMGYTVLSVGSVFATEKYDGSSVTSYTELEPHFGTAEEFSDMIKYFHDKDIKVMVDFPLTNVSANHEWVQDASKKAWVAGTADGKAQFALENADFQGALKKAIVDFVSTYKVDGIRLTNINGADTAFVNELISAIKEVHKNIYVISNEESDADFDADFHADIAALFSESYKNVDLSSSEVTKYVQGITEGNIKPSQLMIDSIWTDRFTYAVMSDEGNHYPPNRLPLAYAASLLMPGVPVTQYGTEIGMNGKVGPESHQLYNFKTDEELIDFIKNLQTLRNDSATLRHGKFEVLKNEDGFLVFKRQSEKESWIVVLNNTSITNRIDLSTNVIGEGKELRGMFENDIIRVNKEGNYPVILDRESIEVYQVIDETGINMSYVITLAIVYILFTIFVVMVVKRGRKRRAAQDMKK